ncbi:two-component sensor histidine kinase [Bradyrhizobium sp. U87765 SZCCT0131]|nr:two-component sensor histidine kinase [Bradyrhizobium sp. U87765 SZCCT0131]MBR1260092.1 two-component sensor histidine kinase [Bradyrhizobium sp. U87765 SZCCT0134]MBR1307659.1 two-component sensor histidine kinase [Bradyrhizobium sp. U87765 SZCCT0110]MBR1321613.1 two-component sensor histidine kinase [Bradyrhizobium sp. U87765 SZCCT0109]MBR1349926.1 two-component sensor histidine kinase [Bradyrhizobium sp. U87765 SZCCT0048]
MAASDQTERDRDLGLSGRTTPSPLMSQWSERLRRAAIILVAGALALGALVVFGDVSFPRALAVFVCLVAGALIPWRLHDAEQARGEGVGAVPVETPVVRAVVEGMPDPAVLLDRAGRVLHFNTAAGQLAPALRKGELAQFALRSPEIITALRQAIATAEPKRTTYLDHVPVDRWMELIVTPIAVPTAFGGSDYCMLMTFHDQTPLRRVEEMRADFVANASHELRTPLAALSGFIDTLQGPAREDPKARERFLAIMHAQATRMARLIDDLLSLSRVELSAHVRPDTSVDIVTIIRQVVDGLESLAKERQVAIEVDLPTLPIAIAGDREELLRLFENLIENALKYGASGGRVIVSLVMANSTDGAPEVRVLVRDFGPGIAPEHLPRLTERFYRVDVGDSRNQGGTGLGLSLVKHILNRHRGRLLIESVPAKGATFTACFPQTKTAQNT